MGTRLVTGSLIVFLAVSASSAQTPLGTAFTYQGRLKSGGSLADGSFNMDFKLYPVPAGGTLLASQTLPGVAVTDGLFTVQLDFGAAAFDGNQRWLDVTVNGTPLVPRQELTAAPYALQVRGVHVTEGNGLEVGGDIHTTGRVVAGAIGSNSPLIFLAPSLPFPGVERARIDDVTGNFGLGTTSPSSYSHGGTTKFMEIYNTQATFNSQALVMLSTGSTSAGSSIGGISWNIPNTTGFQKIGAVIGGGIESLSTSTASAYLAFLTTSAGSIAERMRITAGGNVGIGTSAPAYKLEVVDNSTPRAVSGFNNFLNGAGVYGESNHNFGGSAGVRGQTNFFSDTGVEGNNTAPGGANCFGVHGISANGFGVAGTGPTGVVGESFSSGGVGVQGYTSNPTGIAGVYGYTFFAPVGVLGKNFTTSGTTYGVRGESVSPSGTGVFGLATATSGTIYGVLGQAVNTSGSAGPEFGVFANGDMGASGNKPFRIDHPDDPENKYLLHYAAESPEVINFYSGKATLDGAGEAVVELPHYFAKINKDPRYTLTAVGAPMPMLHVAEEIDEAALNAGARAEPCEAALVCWFRIAGGAPGAKVSWEVKAVRNDRWVQQRGAPVEVEKQGLEKGTYQHPELYNQPPEKGMNYDATRQRHDLERPSPAVPEVVRASVPAASVTIPR